MERTALYFLLSAGIGLVSATHLDYLDPVKLQTKTDATTQESFALKIISAYNTYHLNVTVDVDPVLFRDNKDVFALRTSGSNYLSIRASSGVAAVWGYNYFLKHYCKSQITWQVQNFQRLDRLPKVDVVVVANDRFRYYQNVCTASYSFSWWGVSEWIQHVGWMALNGINIALAPVAQEAAWARVYRHYGLTQEEIDEHFTGPAFLSWQRMGNLRGWAGPLPDSWHELQNQIQTNVIRLMTNLGMVPVLPSFSGHVPRALERYRPNATFHTVDPWNKFSDDFCCGLFLDPADPLFKEIGTKFMQEFSGSFRGHVYSADPFNEVKVQPWSTALVQKTAQAIFSTLSEVDEDAVWLLQNWMFVHDPVLWPKERVRAFLTAAPLGRVLVLDLQAEQWPQYEFYEMYFGQPFIWCMLHNFGGTLGMFGNMQTINRDVYTARTLGNSTMIGTGLTPEGINQNYVVYDLMLEAAYRKQPVDLAAWVEEYAERRYGCAAMGKAWRFLLKSVYSFDGLNKIRGKYVITRRPSFKIKPWAWYKSSDLILAWREFALINDNTCNTAGFYQDLVDVTRQALQYRAEQLYRNVEASRLSNIWVFNATINQFLDAMQDIEQMLRTNNLFSVRRMLDGARDIGRTDSEKYLYEFNARNQITLWGPNGEISDYACKQWTELFHYYYIPRWRAFLTAALYAKEHDEFFDEKGTQDVIKQTIEQQFTTAQIFVNSSYNDDNKAMKDMAFALYKKWAVMPGLEDLPVIVLKPNAGRTTLPDVEDSQEATVLPTVVRIRSTTTVN